MTKVLFIDFNICPYFLFVHIWLHFNMNTVLMKNAHQVYFTLLITPSRCKRWKKKLRKKIFFFWSFTLPSYFAFFGSGKFREPDKNDWAGIHNYIFFVHALIEIDQRAGTTLVRYFCWWQAHIWQLIDFSSDTLSPPSVGFYFLWHFLGNPISCSSATLSDDWIPEIFDLLKDIRDPSSLYALRNSLLLYCLRFEPLFNCVLKLSLHLMDRW